MEGPKVKGVAFRSVERSLAQLRGAPAVERAIEATDPEVGSRLRLRGIVSGGWYPIEWYRAWLAGIRAGTGEGRDLLREIGAQCASNDLKGIYRFFLKMLSPERIFEFTPRFFNNFYDTGKAEIVASRTGYTHARYTGCTGFDGNMWAEAMGSAERVLELAGARHVRFRRFAGGEDGDDHLEVEAHWAVGREVSGHPPP
ncbi:MAG: hypothetical protein ACODAU_00065 [Myxococcota bacterium]